MEKLIELLNKQMEEQEKTGPKLARFISYDGINKVFDLNNGCSFGVEFVLSKRYEFIKWLLENNKIDTEKIENSDYYLIDWRYYYERKKFGIERKEDLEEILLMLLSIQDNPIEFLISILKD